MPEGTAANSYSPMYLLREAITTSMKLLITGAWAEAKKNISLIESMGCEVCFQQQEKDTLSCPYSWPEGVICNGLFLSHPISRFTNLRYVQLTSAGFDRIPIEEIEKRKITVHNARGVYSIPMAEFAVAGVLNLYKRMGQFREQQIRHEWVKNRQIRELSGSRVLIVGCGSVGTACAGRFRAFGCRVTGVDSAAREVKNNGQAVFRDFSESGSYDRICGPQALEEELAAADVVVLALPLTRETRGLIDARKLQMIQGILVNISRGGVVDQEALEKWDGAAVLDVFKTEPLDADSPLWEKPDTIITPHNSFVSEKNGMRLKELILKNLGEYLEYG